MLAGGLGVLIVVAAAALVSTGVLGWAGSDDRARLAIENVRPGYVPWFQPCGGRAAGAWRACSSRSRRRSASPPSLSTCDTSGAGGATCRAASRRGGLNLIDSAAHGNRLARVSAVEKMTFTAGLLLLALVLPPVPGDLFVIAAAVVATLAVARVPWGVYAKVMTIPLVFLLIGVVPLLFSLTLGGHWLVRCVGGAQTAPSWRCASRCAPRRG